MNVRFCEALMLQSTTDMGRRADSNSSNGSSMLAPWAFPASSGSMRRGRRMVGRLGILAAVDQRDFRVRRDRGGEEAAGVAHPDGELRVVECLRRAVERQHGLTLGIDVGDPAWDGARRVPR